MDITFDHLVAKVITPQIMATFTMVVMPLTNCSDLGFAERHAQTMEEDDSQRVFALTKDPRDQNAHTLLPSDKVKRRNQMIQDV